MYKKTNMTEEKVKVTQSHSEQGRIKINIQTTDPTYSVPVCHNNKEVVNKALHSFLHMYAFSVSLHLHKWPLGLMN